MKIKDCKWRLDQKETVRHEGTFRYWICVLRRWSSNELCPYHGNASASRCEDFAPKEEEVKG